MNILRIVTAFSILMAANAACNPPAPNSCNNKIEFCHGTASQDGAAECDGYTWICTAPSSVCLPGTTCKSNDHRIGFSHGQNQRPDVFVNSMASFDGVWKFRGPGCNGPWRTCSSVLSTCDSPMGEFKACAKSFMNAAGECGACSALHDQCLDCAADGSACTECAAGFVASAVTGCQPEACAAYGPACKKCGSGGCLECHTGYEYDAAQGQCVVPPPPTVTGADGNEYPAYCAGNGRRRLQGGGCKPPAPNSCVDKIEFCHGTASQDGAAECDGYTWICTAPSSVCLPGTVCKSRDHRIGYSHGQNQRPDVFVNSMAYINDEWQFRGPGCAGPWRTCASVLSTCDEPMGEFKACAKSFMNARGECGACSALHDQCLDCAADGSACTECAAGFVVSSAAFCQPAACAANGPACVSCSGGACAHCAAGYSLTDGACVKDAAPAPGAGPAGDPNSPECEGYEDPNAAPAPAPEAPAPAPEAPAPEAPAPAPEAPAPAPEAPAPAPEAPAPAPEAPAPAPEAPAPAPEAPAPAACGADQPNEVKLVRLDTSESGWITVELRALNDVADVEVTAKESGAGEALDEADALVTEVIYPGGRGGSHLSKSAGLAACNVDIAAFRLRLRSQHDCSGKTDLKLVVTVAYTRPDGTLGYTTSSHTIPLSELGVSTNGDDAPFRLVDLVPRSFGYAEAHFETVESVEHFELTVKTQPELCAVTYPAGRLYSSLSQSSSLRTSHPDYALVRFTRKTDDAFPATFTVRYGNGCVHKIPFTVPSTAEFIDPVLVEPPLEECTLQSAPFSLGNFEWDPTTKWVRSHIIAISNDIRMEKIKMTFTADADQGAVSVAYPGAKEFTSPASSSSMKPGAEDTISFRLKATDNGSGIAGTFSVSFRNGNEGCTFDIHGVIMQADETAFHDITIPDSYCPFPQSPITFVGVCCASTAGWMMVQFHASAPAHNVKIRVDALTFETDGDDHVQIHMPGDREWAYANMGRDWAADTVDHVNVRVILPENYNRDTFKVRIRVSHEDGTCGLDTQQDISISALRNTL